MGRREIPEGKISCVIIDYTASTIEVIEHIVAHGHQQVVYLGSREKRYTEPSQDREKGYRLAHEQLKIPLNSAHMAFLQPDDVTAELIQRFLAGGVTAFLAEDDALGLALCGCQLRRTHWK